MVEQIVKPDPDPTLLTTAALLREIDQLRNLVRGWVDSLQLLLESRIEAATLVRETQIKSIASVIGARLDGNDTALQAALQAAEKAVAKQNESFALATKKSEDALFKQLDQLGVLINTANKGLEDKINDVRDRLTRYEGGLAGVGVTHAEGRDNLRTIIASVAVVVAIVTGFLGFLFGHTK
jgi:hypothetical protein